MNKQHKKSTKLLIIIFLGLLLFGLGMAVAYIDQQLAQANIQKATKITLRGTITCLPHKDEGGIHTTECAVGLKAENGSYYSLSNNQYPEASGRVEVTGYLKPVPDAQKALYKSVGVIDSPIIVSIK